MRASALASLAVRDLRRSLRRLWVAALGITVGVATLAFFVALGAGLRDVVLGRIFPIDRIEAVPRTESAGAVSAVNALLSGEGAPEPEGVSEATVARLRALPGVRAVYPKMRLLFPSSGRGGRAVLGRDVGTGELVVDGIDPALVTPDLAPVATANGLRFEPPAPLDGAAARACRRDGDCDEGTYCDVNLADNGAPQWPGQCARPVPAVVSPYLVEVFDGAIAPAHRLPPLGQLLLRAADGAVLEWDLGRAGLGMASRGRQRRVHARVVGVTPRAIDLGFTVPLATARALNEEFAGPRAAREYTSLVVLLRHPSDTSAVSAALRAAGLELRTSGAEQMGLLVAVITAVLSLSSGIVVLLAALNIAHAFGALVSERRGEMGLFRALGATRGAVRALVLSQAAAVGIGSATVGLVLARLAAFAWNRVAATRMPAFPFKPDDWFVWSAGELFAVAGFAVGACLLATLAPATRAARIDPAQALAGGV